METNKLVSSLCYFSIFFAPFLLPIAVYFIVDHQQVKEHAKKAFISHIIPFLTILLFIVPLTFSSAEATIIGGIFVFLLIGVINIVVFIWNIVYGVKVLME